MKKISILFIALVTSVGTMFAESGTCGDNLTWDLTDGVLTINGSGDMTDWFWSSDVPWYSYRESITSVTIPNSVTSIGERAFWGCYGLTSVTIPNSVTSIGAEAFAHCSGLTSVTIPNSVTSIGINAFYECTSMTSITIPNSVTSIGNFAFEGCTGLSSVTIGNSVTSIGELAFWACYGLTSVVVETGNIVYDSRENCNAIIETATNTLITGCQNTTIPNSVTSIGDGAFAYCVGLTSIEIPNSVTSIGDVAFYNCTGLTSVTIGNSVTSIGEGAFSNCSGLTSITCEAANPPTCDDSYVFYNVDKSIPLYVPAASIQAYKTANAWSDFTNIQATSTQGIDDVETGIKATKFLHNDQIYILRGDHSYTITGQEVR